MTQDIRVERDSFGNIDVPANRLWGAQTQRSLEKFSIGDEPMPTAVIHALGAIKHAAARANVRLGVLETGLAAAIGQAAAEVAAGEFDDHFPLKVWQTGSGTQSNMNANEVIANRASQIRGGEIGPDRKVHPNDDVNRSQSSNDTFPTAMHVATLSELHDRLIPALAAIRGALEIKSVTWADIVKLGRTHLQDATPITLGQEFSGYVAQIKACETELKQASAALLPLPQGATAVGTGLNAPVGFDKAVCEELALITGLAVKPTENKFAGIAAHDRLVSISGALNTLAVALSKIANDIRFMGAGPRAGIGELILPANEPGSSMMPGKVNPTQIEALTMVCSQVMGNHTTVSLAGASGHLELNAYKPVIIYNIVQSIRLLSDAATSFTEHCLAGLEPNRARIEELLQRSLMLVTTLATEIGYDKAAKIAKHAYENGATLREAALELGHVDGATFDKLVRPERMLGPQKSAND